MPKIRLSVTKSACREGTCRAGDVFIVDTLCPPLCHELWHAMYPFVYALQNGAQLDYGECRSPQFDVRCPDDGRVEVHGEVIPD